MIVKLGIFFKLSAKENICLIDNLPPIIYH